MAWLENYSLVPGGVYDFVYRPLEMISNQHPRINAFFNWYECDLWGVAHSFDHPMPTAFGL